MNQILRTAKSQFPLIAILTFFCLVFASISLVNHYNFRTFGWDLGINNNAIFDYIHFRWNDCMVMQPQFTNVLSDHFSLYPIFASPLQLIFGSYAMLMFQLAMVVFGGLGIYRYVKYISNSEVISNLAVVHFFCFWGLYSAMAFDYHDNVVAAMFVPWLLYYFKKGNQKLTLLFLFLVLIGKENMALWSVFISMGLVLQNWKDKEQRKRALIMMGISGLYFLTVVKLIIPSLANEGREYLHFHYEALGADMKEAVKTVITNPKKVFSLLFESHLPNAPEADYIKTELWFMLIVSGGVLIFFRPWYALMLIPILGQKLFSDDYGKWGLNNQYSIEFAPIICIAAFDFIQSLATEKYRKYAAIAVVVFTAFFTVRSFDPTWRVSKWYMPDLVNVGRKQHWKRDFDVNVAHEAMKVIPENAKVSAQSYFVPRLCFRDFIYQYPTVNDAEYIMLRKSDESYPLPPQELAQNIAQMGQPGSGWSKVFEKENIYVFKKQD